MTSRSVNAISAKSRRKRKRDFSLRKPTALQERSGKKKSARSVRNDGWALADCKEESNVCKARPGVVSQLCIAARKRFGEYPSGSHGSEVVGVAAPDIMSVGKNKDLRH
jgi:hypothetical protein